MKTMKIALSLMFLAWASIKADVCFGAESIQTALRASMTVETNFFRLGEPVLLKINLTNTGSQPVSILTPKLERFSYPTVVFFVKGPEDKDYVQVQSAIITSGSHKIVPPPKTIAVTTLDSGDEFSAEFFLAFDFPTLQNRRWLFPVAGSYLIKAQLQVLDAVQRAGMIELETGSRPKSQTIETTVLTIDVAPSGDESDYRAWNDLQHLPVDFLLYAPEEFDPELHPLAESEIQTFVKEHAASRFAPIGNMFLAHAKLKKAMRLKDTDAINDAISNGQALLTEKKLPRAMIPKLEQMLQNAQAFKRETQN